MEHKHTPGPWQISAGAVDNPRLIVENDLGLPVCAMSLRGVQGDTKVMEANANLVASAPDLLEALIGYMNASALAEQAMKDGINVHGAVAGLIGWTDRAHAAIARATGTTT